MTHREHRTGALRHGSRLVGALFAVLSAAAVSHCGFPDFGGFDDGRDASAGGMGGLAGSGGQGGTGGSGQGGAGGTSAGGTGGSAPGGTGGSQTGGTGGTQTGGFGGTDTGGTGGSGTGGTGTGGVGGSATGGVGGTGTGGTDTGGTGGDAGPEATLPLLNVWHIPTNAEPPTVTMRNPVLPTTATTDVYVYVGEPRPEGQVAGGSLVWWWSNGSTSTPPQTVDLVYDTHNGNNDYWRASMPMPSRLVGTFKYYFKLEPVDKSSYATTYLFGTDTTTNTTATETAASAAPYVPTYPLPQVGELVITEVMVNAYGTQESSKEWFELVATSAGPVHMNGLLLADSSDANIHTVQAPDLILWPGVYATFGASADSANLEGFSADYAYGTGMSFSNSGDAVRVMLPDKTIVDSVAWTSSTSWPYHTDGHSMQYNTSTPVATGNDVSAAWCESKKPYGTGTSYGTPNAPSDGCQP